MPRSRKAPVVDPEPWQEMDWSSNGPYGAAQQLRHPLPCGICRRSSYLLSPRKQVPMHKVCAEEFMLVSLLAPILVALGTTSVPRDALH